MVWVALLAAVVAIGGVFATWAHFRAVNSLSTEEVTRLRAEMLAMGQRIDGLTRLANENREGVQGAKDRAAHVRGELDVERGRLIETRQNLEHLRLEQHEKSARQLGNTALVLREARRNTGVASVERLLLLVTIHRSASTTLFDIFRGHPEVFFEPTATLWQDIGLRGRRYPVDLSNGPTGELAVEVEPGVGALIPSARECNKTLSIAIEKAHPQFFDFDANAFAEQLEQLERDAPYGIDLVFGIRRPLDAMWSMIEYQQRNPLWYQFLKPAAVPEFIERSIAAIETLHSRIPGRIIDYSDVTEASAELRETFSLLGAVPATDADFDAAFERFTAKNRSGAQSGRFVGEGPGERDPLGPDQLWASASDTIASATQIYERLRSKHHGKDSHGT